MLPDLDVYITLALPAFRKMGLIWDEEDAIIRQNLQRVLPV